jgi:tetratricopeptide (TPR) repeat protein
MKDNRREQIYNNLISKETEDLLEIWQNGDSSEWDKEVFEIIKEILLERLGYVPPQSIEKQTWQILDKVDELVEKNELDKALSECETAIQINPGFAIAYNYRGEIYIEKEQLENAIVDFQKAIELDPELEDAWENMLSVEMELEEEFEESIAKQHLDQALEYAYDDEPEKALAECETAKLSIPNIAIAYNYFGLILQTLNQLESAIDSYIKAIQLNPRFYAARENLANARMSWEEEQYRLFSSLPLSEAQETAIEIDESQIPESEEPLPQWLYMDEKAFLVVGWAGHRTRQGRSGYDPLEGDFEYAHMQGVIVRLLLNRKLRTRNPIYLIFMTFVGFLYLLYGIAPFMLGNFVGVITGIISIPYSVVGILLLTNVYLSFQLEISDEIEDNGHTFF